MSLNKKFKSKTKDESGAEDVDYNSEAESNAANTPKEDEKKLTNLSLGDGTKKLMLPRNPALSARDQLIVKKKSTTTKYLVDNALQKLAEPNGASIIAIKKYITSNNPEKATIRLNSLIKRYIKKAVNEGNIIQKKGHFKLAGKPVKPKSELKTKVKATKQKVKPVELKKIKPAEKPSPEDEENNEKAENIAKVNSSTVVKKEEPKKKLMKEKKADKNNNSKSKPTLKRKSIVTAKTTMVAIKTQVENKSKNKNNNKKESTNTIKEKVQSEAVKTKNRTKKGAANKQQQKKIEN